jgi:O-antigen/teichoic acid export membrane protein
MWAMLLVAAVGWRLNQAALNSVCKREGVKIRYRGVLPELGVLWSFSLPALMAGAMYLPVPWIANAMLVNQQGGYGQMGIMNAVAQWRSALSFFPAIAAQVVLPVLSSLYGKRLLLRFRKTLWLTLGTVSCISLLSAIPVILASSRIMHAYGAGFEHAGVVLAITAVAAVLASPASVIGLAISSIGRMWHGFGLNCIWAVAFVALAQSLIAMGAYGLALAYLYSYIVHLISVTTYLMLALATGRLGRQRVPVLSKAE